MANRFLNNIKINDSYTLPSADGTANQIIVTDGSGNLSFTDNTVDTAASADKALSLTLRVKNTEAVALTKGQVVCAAPTATPPSGNVIEVKLADNDGTDSMPAIGILNEGLDAAGGANDEGEAIMFGRISGINTSAFNVGDEVFVSDTPGALTATKPTGVKYIQKIGVVMRDDASNGTIEVFGAGRVNDVPTPLYIDHANQRVGIGVELPAQKLHVYGRTRLQENAQTLDLVGTDHTYIGFYPDGTSGGRKAYIGFPGATNNRLTIANEFNDDIAFLANGSERLTVQNDGNVGIGTTSPSAPLHIYQPSTSGLKFSRVNHDDIDLSLEGSNRFVISNTTDGLDIMSMLYDTGNVGIGTTSPGAKLEVNGNIAINAGQKIQLSGSADSTHHIYHDATTDYDKINYSSGFQLEHHTSGIQMTLVGSGGNVGIGTTSPGAKLDVSGGDIRLSTNATYLRSKDSASAAPRVLGMNSANTFYIGPIDSYAGGGIIYGLSSNVTYHGFWGGGGEKVRITSGGNVGIGTTSPGKKLDINGDTIFRGELVIDGDSSVHSRINQTSSYLEIVGNTTDTTDGARVWIGTGQTDQGFYVNASQHFFRGLDSSTKMYISTGTGNVGIGTTSPGQKLSVAPSTDVSGEFGYAHVGNVGYNGYAGFSHVNLNSQGNYALLQESTGTTFLNASSGQSIKFRINNSDKMLLDSSGNFSIGANTTSAKLEVRQDANNGDTGAFTNTHVKLTASATADNTGFVGITAATSTSDNYGYSFGAQRTSGGVGSFKINYHNNSAAGTNRFIIDQNGKVGIGTASPNRTFTVASNDFAIAEFSRNTAGGGAAIVLQDGNDSEYELINGVSNFQIRSNFTDTQFHITRSTGNVGIGTTSPAEKLAVDGSIRIPRTKEFYWTDGSVNGNTRAVIFSTDNEFGGDYNGIGFSIGADGRTNPSMYIRGTGNVGIGTTSPAQKLDVNGNIKMIETAATVDTDKFIVSDSGVLKYRTGAEIRDDIDAIGGSGTGGTIALFTASGTDLGDSIITQSSQPDKITIGGQLSLQGSGDVLNISHYSGSVWFIDTSTGDDILFGAPANNTQNVGVQGDLYAYNGDLGTKSMGSFNNKISRTGNSYFNAGNVGIGTTSPSQKLTINGTDQYVATQHTSFPWDGSVTIGLKMGTDNAAGLLDFRRWTGSATLHGTALITQVSSDGGYGLDFRVDNKSTNTSATTSRMFLSTSGEVGIGTISPAAKLEVNGTSLLRGLVNITTSGEMLRLNDTNSSGNPYMSFYQNGTRRSFIQHADTGDFLKLASEYGGISFFTGTGGTETQKVTIQSGGNVGIGTTSPGAKLDVSGGDIRLSTNATYLRSKDSASAAPRVLGMNSANTFYIGPIDSYAGGGIIYGASSNVTYHGFWGGGGEKVRITSGGNVGIGTTSPSAMLHVSGSQDFVLIESTANSDATYRSKTTLGYYGSGTGIGSATNCWNVYDFNAGSERMRINSSGNVGIGTTGPTSQLSNTNVNSTDQAGIGHSSTAIAWRSNNQGYTATFDNYLDSTISNGLLVKTANTGTASYISKFESGGINRMSIRSDGNVGIGTTSPQAKLHVANGTLRTWTPIAGTSAIFESTESNRSFITITGANESELWFGDATTQAKGRVRYENNNNIMEFWTNANPRMYISQDGNIGIGTASPGQKLEVAGNIYAKDTNYCEIGVDQTDSAKIRMGVSSGGVNTFIDASNTGAGHAAGTPNIRLLFNASEKFRFTGGGNFGIGTTSPQEKLHVQNQTTGESHQAMFKGGAVTVGDYSYISLNNGYSTEYNKEVRLAAVAELSTSNKTGFAILTSPDSNGASGHERLRVTADGNVGIGTTNPAAKLHISSGTANEDCVVIIQSDTDNNDETSNPRLELRQDGDAVIGRLGFRDNTNSLELINEYAEALYLGTSNSTDLTILSNGNVGIGQTNPSTYKLDVSGTIRATGDVIAYSDIRVKENISTIENALDKVKKLRGVEYNKIDNPERSIGVIAQEIEDVLPEVVKEDNEGMKSVAYGNITAVLIEAIKEQQKQIDELKNQLDAFTK